MRSYLPRSLGGRTSIARRYRYVFIVTYGRSGSTLLMGIVNTIPGYRIRGENLNALYRLYQADAAIREAHRQHGPTDGHTTRDAWYGASSWRPKEFRRTLVDNFVTNILAPAQGDRVLGFKEIRYTEGHIKDLAEYLEFIRAAFPSSQIVFNHRRPSDVAQSAWWTETSGAEDRIQAADARMLSFPTDERHFHFYYDEIDDSLDNIRALFSFLGEDVDEARVREALGTPHSYRRNPRDGAAPPARTLGRRLRRAVRTAANRLR